MRNCSEIWCSASDVSITEIQNRACQEFDAGNFPTTLFISLDLYAQLQKNTQATMRYGGQTLASHNVMSIRTSVADLMVQPVKRLKNFLMVSRKEDFDALMQNGIDPRFWNDEEIARINKAFEDFVILEGNDET